MKVYEFEEMVNKQKLCCVENLSEINGIPETHEQPFELWEKQGYFEALKKAEENLERCGFHLSILWEYDVRCVEYYLYYGEESNKKLVTLFSGNVFSWKQVEDIAKAVCVSQGRSYKH